MKQAIVQYVKNKIKYTFKLRRRKLKTKNEWIGNFVNATEIIQKAKSKCMDVREYLEELYFDVGQTDAVIAEMKNYGCLEYCDCVCEIGPGTGGYLEKVLKHIQPKQYHIYETDSMWADFLEKKYSPKVVRMQADGRTLSYTQDASCGLVHAHGVFVYLKRPLYIFEYFLEMVRICNPNGFVVLDFFSDEYFDTSEIKIWLKSRDRCAIILPKKTVTNFFIDHNFVLLHEFTNKCTYRSARSHSHYLIFQKTE